MEAIRRLDALSQLPRQKHNMKKNKQKAIEESEEQRETREKAVCRKLTFNLNFILT